MVFRDYLRDTRLIEASHLVLVPLIIYTSSFSITSFFARPRAGFKTLTKRKGGKVLVKRPKLASSPYSGDLRLHFSSIVSNSIQACTDIHEAMSS